MRNLLKGILCVMALAMSTMTGATGAPGAPGATETPDYYQARWDPIHFKPAIDQARDEQCLACHREVLSDKVRDKSPAGVAAATSKAWYQKTSTYEGVQDTFHRRHMVTPLSKSLMKMRCNTCHQGNDPREETVSPPTQGDAGFTLRKMVNTETTCLKCHGQMSWQTMGLPGPWQQSGKAMGNNCQLCHAAIRTNRHQVSYLNAAEIERAGTKNSEVCFGCHGGRAWYGTNYAYPRHAWPNMPAQTPDWAKGRPTESEKRFQLQKAAATSGK